MDYLLGSLRNTLMIDEYFNRVMILAQDSGYDVKYSTELVCWIGEDFSRCLSSKEIWVDKGFWEALGRALGWNDLKTNPKNVSWLEHWHLFIDHLAGEKEPELFFKELIKHEKGNNS